MRAELGVPQKMHLRLIFRPSIASLDHKHLLMYILHKDFLMKTEDLVFRAIAHPARRAMLSILATSARSVKELTNEFAMSQPAVSQHLKELKESHLVSSDRVGLEQRYRLTPNPLRYIIEWSAQYRTLIDPAGHAWSLLESPAAKRVAAVKRRRSHGG